MHFRELLVWSQGVQAQSRTNRLAHYCTICTTRVSMFVIKVVANSNKSSCGQSAYFVGHLLHKHLYGFPCMPFNLLSPNSDQPLNSLCDITL